MTAHWVVLVAAALTTLVAAAVGAALAAFAGQALPQAVRHDLTVAQGTSLTAVGAVSSTNYGPLTAALKTAIGTAMPGVPFGFWDASWSDPLGFVPGARPARPASAGRGSIPLLEAAALAGVRQYAVLVTGQWPAAPGLAAERGPAAARTPVPAALPASVAALLHVTVGDVLRFRDRVSNTPVAFKVTGLFAERALSGPAAPYWQLNSVPAGGSSTLSGFVTYGPLVVDPAAFPAALPVSGGTWVAQPDMAAFTGTNLSTASANVTALEDSLANSATLSGLQLTTSLPAVLAGTASNLAVARSLLAISALQLLVLTVAALLAVARLLATQREAETALLNARGATRWQLTTLTAAEVTPLCATAAIAGGAAGVWLARLLGGTLYKGGGGVSASGIDVTAAATWLDALGAMLVVAVLAIGAMLFPVLRPAPAARVGRGRQAAIAGATRAGADVALVLLAVLAGWQLRRYSAVSTTANGTAGGIDPVLALAPALALAGGTVATLRLLPAAARAIDRLAARGRKLTAPLAGWQFSRQPLRQGGAALLLVMAVATGTLALAQHESWSRSAGDQAAFTAGADVRADLVTPLAPGATGGVTHAAGVQGAMAAAVLPEALPAQVVAVDAAAAPRVALLRPDQSSLPSARLFQAIAPAGGPSGTATSGRPGTVQLTATLGLARTVLPLPDIGVVTVTLTVTDATGSAYQLPAGTLPPDSRPHLLTATLGGTQVSYPLRLTQLTLAYLLPAMHSVPLILTLSGARLNGWSYAATSPELTGLLNTAATLGPSGQPAASTWRTGPDGAILTFDSGFGQAASNPGTTLPGPPQPVYGQVTLMPGGLAPAAVPAIATKAFIDASNTGIGATVPATIGGASVPVKIVAETTTFPTVSGPALIVDLATIQSFLASRDISPLSVNQWWLATAGHQVPAALASALPPGSGVTSRTALAAAALADPLGAAPQQALLALAAAAVLLAVTGFWVSIAANVRQRRAENALLAALGVGQRSAAAQLLIEKLLLSVPAAALGLVLGTIVARLLVPAVTLTTTAQTPVPPPVTLFDLPQTVSLALFVAVVPALAAALVVIRRPDPAAELRAAEAA